MIPTKPKGLFIFSPVKVDGARSLLNSGATFGAKHLEALAHREGPDQGKLALRLAKDSKIEQPEGGGL